MLTQSFIQHLRHAYETTKGELQAVTGAEPDHDQIVQALLEGDLLEDSDKQYIADMTSEQSQRFFGGLRS